VSMPAVRVFVGSTLVTISFDLPSRDYIFDRNAFYVLFQKFRFRAVIFKLGLLAFSLEVPRASDEYIHNILPYFIFCTLNHFLA